MDYISFITVGPHLLLDLVLHAQLSLRGVPCNLVPFKELFQRTCSQVELQTVLFLVLQDQHVGLPVFSILHYKDKSRRSEEAEDRRLTLRLTQTQ